MCNFLDDRGASSRTGPESSSAAGGAAAAQKFLGSPHGGPPATPYNGHDKLPQIFVFRDSIGNVLCLWGI